MTLTCRQMYREVSILNDAFAADANLLVGRPKMNLPYHGSLGVLVDV